MRGRPSRLVRYSIHLVVLILAFALPGYAQSEAELYEIVRESLGDELTRDELQFRRSEFFKGLVLVGVDIHYGEFTDGYAIYEGRFFLDVSDAAKLVLKREGFAQKDSTTRKRLAYRWFRHCLFAYSQILDEPPEEFPGRFHKPKAIADGDAVIVAAWFRSADGTVFTRAKVTFARSGVPQAAPLQYRRL